MLYINKKEVTLAVKKHILSLKKAKTWQVNVTFGDCRLIIESCTAHHIYSTSTCIPLPPNEAFISLDIKEFLNCLNFCNEESILLELTKGVLKVGQTSLKTAPPIEFQKYSWATNLYTTEVSVPIPEITAAIKAVAAGLPKKPDIRDYLNHVLFSSKEKATASNGHCLFSSKIPEIPQDFLLPKELLFAFTGDESRTALISVSTTEVKIKTASFMLSYEHISARYPSFDKVLTGDNTCYTLSKKELVSLFKQMNTRYKKSLGLLKISDEGLSLTVKDTVAGIPLPCSKGHTTEMGFNVAYLLTAVKDLIGDKIEMTIFTGGNSCMYGRITFSDTVTTNLVMEARL